LLLNPENGWIQNCNSTPFTAALEFSPKKADYPYYMSADQENFRGVHAIELLTNRTGYTLDSLIQLAHDPYLPAFSALLPGLVKAYDQLDRTKELGAPIALLRNWDYRTSPSSVAMTLAHFYGMRSYEKANRPMGLNGMELVEHWGTTSPDSEKLTLFKETIAQLEADFGTWNIPWGEVNRYQRLTGDLVQEFSDDKPSLPVGFASGTWGALAAYGQDTPLQGQKKYMVPGAIVSWPPWNLGIRSAQKPFWQVAKAEIPLRPILMIKYRNISRRTGRMPPTTAKMCCNVPQKPIGLEKGTKRSLLAFDSLKAMARHSIFWEIAFSLTHKMGSGP
jgi:hypothetical protein